MQRNSDDECMRYFLDNGEKLDKDSGTIFEDTIRFVRNMCSIDPDHRFANEKWNYQELGDSRGAQSIGAINEDSKTSHARGQYKVDLYTV